MMMKFCVKEESFTLFCGTLELSASLVVPKIFKAIFNLV